MADINPENYFPLGSTVETSFTDLQTSPSDPKRYEHFGIISVNPLSGHSILIYRKGTHHVGANDFGSIYIRYSYDGGANWSNEAQAFPPETNIDQRGVGGGYDSSGRLFAFYGRYNPNTSTWLSMNYLYSDNDGSTWSNEQSLPTTLTGFLPYGHIIDVGNGVLYQPWYENNFIGPLPGNLSSCRYRLNLYKSTDGGQTFTSVNIYDHTNSIQGGEQFFYTEFSLVNIGGGCFIILVRKDGYDFQEYHQFKSENNCQSWISQGDTSFEQLGSYPAPPWLSFINYEGVGIVSCYYTNRGTQKLNVVYGLAKDLLENGPNGWNVHSPILILNYYGTLNSGYQSFFLPLNQYKGIGVGFKETDVNDIAYPVVVFTSTQSMKDVLLALGL